MEGGMMGPPTNDALKQRFTVLGGMVGGETAKTQTMFFHHVPFLMDILLHIVRTTHASMSPC